MKWKESIEQEIKNDELIDFFCSGYLQKLISFINDKHNQVYISHPDPISNAPTYSKTIDTLQTINDLISGIYYAGEDKVFVKRENEHLWFGVSINQNSENWPEGKIRFKIQKDSNGNLEIFEFFNNGMLFYQKNITIENGRISSTFWNKDHKYYFNKNFNQNFTYEPINSSFDYIGIKTLKRTKTLIAEGKSFYQNNLKKLKKENLIVDLRNNGGGSLNQILPLMKSLKKNKSIQTVYLLINFKTASAAELAVLKLKNDKRTRIVGENSSGMLAYGYGNKAFSTHTECFHYKVILSTTQENKNDVQYEYSGIQPDHYLNNQSDWIEQVIQLEQK